MIVVAATVLPIARRDDGGPPSLLDVLIGAEQANALPADAPDQVRYQRIETLNDLVLLCGDGTLGGDPVIDGRAVVDSWTHGASGRQRSRFADERGNYDFIDTIVEEPEPGRLIVDTEGTLPEPEGGRSCFQGSVADDAPEFDGWQGPDQSGIVATLRSGAALGLAALRADATTDTRAELFRVLGEAPGATLLTEPAVDNAGRPVVSVQVDVANNGQRFVGTWRFDPETYELREIVEYEENSMFEGSTTQTILAEAWLPYDESLFDLGIVPPTTG